MPHAKLLSLSLCSLFTATLVAQAPRPQVGKAEGKAEARAEAKANADDKSSDSSRSSHTVTHKVVVVNGKKIVDERTENGRPAPAGGGAGGAGPVGLPPLPDLDAEEMLRKLREQVEREVGGGLPPLPRGDQPLGGGRASDRATDSSRRAPSSKHSETKGDSAKGATNTGSRPASDRGRLQPRTDKR